MPERHDSTSCVFTAGRSETWKPRIEGKGTRSTEDECSQRSDVEQTCLIPRRAELRAGGGHRPQLD